MTDQNELLPGMRAVATTIRIVIFAGVVIAVMAIASAIECARIDDMALEAATDVNAVRTAEHWRRIRARRERDAIAAQALRDSLLALEKAAPAVRTTIAAAQAARRAVVLRPDPAAAHDTTVYVLVSRITDTTKHAAPKFLLDVIELQAIALDSAVRLLNRTGQVLVLARAQIARDSLDRIDTDSLVASLQEGVRLAEQSIGAAHRRGRREGLRQGVFGTAVVVLLLGAFL